MLIAPNKGRPRPPGARRDRLGRPTGPPGAHFSSFLLILAPERGKFLMNFAFSVPLPQERSSPRPRPRPRGRPTAPAAEGPGRPKWTQPTTDRPTCTPPRARLHLTPSYSCAITLVWRLLGRAEASWGAPGPPVGLIVAGPGPPHPHSPGWRRLLPISDPTGWAHTHPKLNCRPPGDGHGPG